MREEGSGARWLAPRFFLSWAQPAFRAPTQSQGRAVPLAPMPSHGSHAAPGLSRGTRVPFLPRPVWTPGSSYPLKAPFWGLDLRVPGRPACEAVNKGPFLGRA